MSARILRVVALACAVPVAGLLSAHLAGDEFQPIRRKPQTESAFKRVDENVQPIRTTATDSGVKLLSHREALPTPVRHADSRRAASAQQVQLVERGSRKKTALKPLPRLGDLVTTSRQSGKVEDLIEDLSPREQYLDELRRSVNPVQELPLPEAEPVPEPPLETPAELAIEKPAELMPVPKVSEAQPEPEPVAKPEPIPERKIVEVIRVQSEPNWVVMNAKPNFNQRILGEEEVTRLLTRARMELATGDLELAHTFAEAAAEVAIPREVFDKKPELILSEIEYVTARQQSVVKVDYDAFQEGGAPDPNSPTQRLEKDPRGFRAIGKTALSVGPRTVNPGGETQRLPDAETRRQLALLPEVVQPSGFGRGWNAVSYTWQAPALYHSPLYYEEVELERYGNEVCGIQPWVSGAHFYTTFFTLPYRLHIEGNGVMSCQYDLGHNRPGECVPYSLHTLPFSWTGAVTTGAVATGLAFLIP